MKTYLSHPQSGGPHPAVIVIHENRGLNEHIRDVARRFAVAAKGASLDGRADGFAALAPELLSRRGGTASLESADKAREAIGASTAEEALGDLRAGFNFLNAHTAPHRRPSAWPISAARSWASTASATSASPPACRRRPRP